VRSSPAKNVLTTPGANSLRERDPNAVYRVVQVGAAEHEPGLLVSRLSMYVCMYVSLCMYVCITMYVCMYVCMYHQTFLSVCIQHLYFV
jgi:hypothetical protein